MLIKRLTILFFLISFFVIYSCQTDTTVMDGDQSSLDGDMDMETNTTDGDTTDGDATDGDTTDTDITDSDITDSDITDMDLEKEDDTLSYSFTKFEWMKEAPDTSIRICTEAADPEAAVEKIFIDCIIEGESFAPDSVEPANKLVVMAYNIEQGHKLDKQLEAIKNNPSVPMPDVILISEADRGCNRTGNKHIIREYAMALKMNYVYAVEFTELSLVGSGDEQELIADCEHGNGILSRYPLGNVSQLRHQTQANWFERESEQRLGGRVAVLADIKVGESYLHLAAVHFESSISQTERAAQAEEMAQIGSTLTHPVIIGGDMNCGLYAFDLELGTESDKVVTAFFSEGYQDAHQSMPLSERITAPENNFILDIIFGKNTTFTNPQICPEDLCGTLSDHLPVWTTVDIESL